MFIVLEGLLPVSCWSARRQSGRNISHQRFTHSMHVLGASREKEVGVGGVGVGGGVLSFCDLTL